MAENGDIGTSLSIAIEDEGGSGRLVVHADRNFYTDSDGNRYVEHDMLKVHPRFQGEGIATRLNAAMEDVYRANGVSHLVTNANIDVGGYTWARAGWDFDPAHREQNQEAMLIALGGAAGKHGPDVDARLTEWSNTIDTGDPDDWPTPLEVSRLGWTEGATTWPGKEIMLGSSWYGRKDL